jgi:hypothetical protein
MIMLCTALLLTVLTSAIVDVQLNIDSSRVLNTINMDQFLSITLDTSFVRGDFCSINWM